jgi:hypothetical protein
VLLARKVLVTEEEHLPLEERPVQLFEQFIVHGLAKINTAELGTDGGT